MCYNVSFEDVNMVCDVTKSEKTPHLKCHYLCMCVYERRKHDREVRISKF
jgi:hypothetical protein